MRGGKKKRKEEKKKKMTVGPDMKHPTYSLPANSGTGGSHNKARWKKYLCEINSGDKAVIRDRRGGSEIKICSGED